MVGTSALIIRECIQKITPKRGLPKIRGTFSGVPIIRTVVFWGLNWGPPMLGKYHIVPSHRVFQFLSSLSFPANQR